ncbi:TetR/AcrR family transcriptional regulator [Alkalibacter rhizosphaerae]|uniref:TetR/AcrR family transcriptional regulator n=1 Tax=Alkalibacter rhizosphaerae TaxID=2815577 RepID=A0A974XDI0_9FIRM|nr:TetR/AcrR family transcriptional regulator [Alkalibacter rhizosphaerae]QSX07656.1 TetR/AcrR family transcriptional regulator [Alkalibacter rhizosphaerae]
MTRKKNEETQEKIMACTKKLFQEHGYNKTSIRMIAKEMEFKNQASFYIYFKSKDHLTAMILEENSKEVRKFIDSLEWEDTTPLHDLILENLIISEILKDEANRRFYTEAQWQQTLPSMMRQVPNYIDYLHKNLETTITKEELELNIFSYVKLFCSMCQAIDNKETNVTYLEAMKRMPYVFLDLVGVERRLHETIIHETLDLFHRIPEAEIQKLFFFHE